MVARTRRRAVVAREESSSAREETFAAAIATPLDAGTSDGEILLNPRDSPSEGVDVDEHARGDIGIARAMTARRTTLAPFQTGGRR
mmetsp:Transcript_2216/g.8268  ORF Transcript_2216/g.8268 Transcript_2216/m.8268 type:complete len:86 (-) Transcript_2216:2027-2284(-)